MDANEQIIDSLILKKVASAVQLYSHVPPISAKQVVVHVDLKNIPDTTEDIGQGRI